MPELKYFYTCMELWGCLFAFMASIYLVIGKSVIRDQYIALAKLEFVAGIMLFFDAWAWFFDGVPGDNIRQVLFVSNYVSFVSNALIPVFLAEYVVLSVEKPVNKKKITITMVVLAVCAVLFLTISQLTGFVYTIDKDTNLYERGLGFVIWTLFVLVEANIVFAYAFSKKDDIERKRFAVIISFIVLPILATAAQMFVYGINLSNMAIILVSLLMFAQVVEHNARTLFKHNETLADQETLLQDMRTRIALSQIQPDFLYNTLGTIKELCDKDVNKAKELIGKLSDYLGESITSIDVEKPVPFEKELEHTKVYLEIERTESNNRFEVSYDLKVTDFELPALTIQPIVENAVQHGIYKMKSGTLGLISIKTREGNGYIKVSISDNGAGFDVAEYEGSEKDNEDHIGIANVKNRLKIMKDAEMRIFSKVGEGTTIDIIIPNK